MNRFGSFDIESEFMDLGVVPSMPVLDIKMYNKHVYLGCKEGLYEFLYDEIGSKNGPKIKKGFDEKIVHVDAKFDTVSYQQEAVGCLQAVCQA